MISFTKGDTQLILSIYMQVIIFNMKGKTMNILKTNILWALFTIMLLNIASVASAQVTKEDERQSIRDYNDVVAALQPYIDSAKTGDGKVIRTAFYEHAHIVGSINGTIYNSDLNSFEKSVSNGGPSPKVEHRIVWIDVSGPAAAAKVEFINWGGFRFTDFFVLYKSDGQWKISGKVYDSHSQN